MARNSERDVELVIRARDEAERALNKITDALLGMSKAQQTVTGTAKGADGAIASLTQEVAELEARLKGLGDMGALVRGLDKSAGAVNKLEGEVAQTVADLERLKQEAAAAAAAVAQAEQKKAAVTKGTKEERQAANRALSEAQREEKTLARDMERQNVLLQARIDRLERAKAAYDQLQQSANRAGAAMGVSPTRESVQSATASTQRQLGDARGAVDTEVRLSEQAAKLRDQLDPLAAAQKRYNNELAELNALVEAGKITQDEFAAAQAVAKQRLDATAAALEANTQEYKDKITAQREAEKAAQEAAAAEARLVAQAAKLREQIDPLGAAQDRYNKELAELNTLLSAGKISQGEFNAGQAAAQSRLDATTLSLQQNTEEYRQQVAAQKATEQAAKEAAAAEARLVQQAERLRGQLNPLGAAQDRYNQELRELEQMYERNLIDQKQFADGQALITRRLNESKAALDRVNGEGGPDMEFMGLRPYELTNLSYQINDVITGLASGQPVVQILAQQGGQFVQIFGRQMQGVLPMLFRLGPLFLAAGAAAAVFFGAMGRGMRQIENLRQFEGVLKATANSATFTAQQLAAATEQIDKMGLKTDEARQIVRSFMREGINPAMIVPFTEAAKDLADVMGMEVPEAARRMAEGFSKGYEEIKQLDEEFQFLTAAEREQIKVMFESGRATEARRLAFDRFYKLMDDGAKAMKGPWEQAMSRMGRAWGNLLDGFSKTWIIQGAIKGIEGLGNAINQGSIYMEEMVRNWNRYGGVMGTIAFYSDRINGRPVGGAAPGSLAGADSGMSQSFVDRVIGVESGGNPRARNPRSTATGAGQFTEGTWLQMFRTYYPEEAQRMSREQILELRNDMAISRRMVELYARESADYFRSVGVAVNDTNLYLAHFAGPQTAARVIQANPNTPVSDIFSPGAVGANPTVLGNGQTAGGLIQWSARKMGQALPGTPGSGSITSTTETQSARDSDYLRNLEEQLVVTEDLTDRERVRMAGVRALREAQSAGLSDAAALRAQELAMTAEQIKVDRERAANQRALSDQIASDFREAGRQTNDLARQQEDIDRQTEARIERLNQARREGITEVNGVALSDIEAQYRANGELLKQRAELEHRERELNALLEQRRLRLQGLAEAYQVDMGEGDADPLAYMQAVNAVLDETSPKIREAADGLRAFVQSTGDDSERAQAALARANAAGGDDVIQRQAASQRVLNDAEKKYNDLLAARDARLASIQQRYYNDPQTMAEETQRVIEETGPAIEAAAQEALRLAERLNAIKPTPELTAFIERARQAANNPDASSREARAAQAAQIEQELNDTLAARGERLAVIAELEERGMITAEEAERRRQVLYQGTNAEIQRLIEARRKLLELMLHEGTLTQAQYDQQIAALDRIQVESGYVDQRTKALKEQLESAFSSSAMNAFDTFARGLAEGKSAIESLGDAFRQFASEFLTQIARMIMQQIILNMLQSMGGSPIPGMGGVQGMPNGGGFFGSLAGVIGKVGRTPSGVQVPTTVPVRHGGGMVGSGSPTRSAFPGLFANAMRYHAGGMVGLRPDEEAAILQTGEEVLSRTDPRNRLNGGAAPVVNNRIINTIDPAEVLSAALGTPAGEKTLINAIRMNKRAIQGALG